MAILIVPRASGAWCTRMTSDPRNLGEQVAYDGQFEDEPVD